MPHPGLCTFRTTLATATILGLLVGLLGPGIQARRAIPPQEDLMTQFQQARGDLLAGRYDLAEQKLQEILQTLETLQMTQTLKPEQEQLYQWCLDYLGRVALQTNRPDEAEFYYLTLLQMNPYYNFPDTPAPTVATFFRELRRRRIGFLEVRVDPPDAVVYLEDRPIGKGGLTAYPVVQGSYRVHIERPGYESWSQQIEIRGGRTTKLGDIVLTRNAAAVFVATRPRQVEVYLDERRVGVTGGEAPEAVRAYAESRSMPADEFSDYLVIPISDNQEHYLEFRKPCYESEQVIIQAPEWQDIYLDPVSLEPAMGQIELNVNAEAEVFVDGQLKGKASQKIFSICAGSHDLTLKNSWSLWNRSIQVIKGDRLQLDVVMWPKVAFLGWFIEEGASDFAIRRARDLLGQALNQIQQAVWIDFTKTPVLLENETHSGQEWGQRIMKRWETGRRDDLKKLLDALGDALESRLFLVGHIPREDIPRHVHFLLFSDLSGVPDRYTVDLSRPETMHGLVYRLNHEEPVLRKVLPFKVVWTRLYPYPLIFWTAPELQASASKDQPAPHIGDILYRIAGIRLETPAQFQEVQQKIQDLDTLTIQFGNPFTQEVHTIEIHPVTTPVELDISSTDAWYNRLAIGFLRWAERPENTLTTHVARLNLGLLYMRFQEWSKAFEWLTQTRLERDHGISQPTVQYHMVETYLQLNMKADALKLMDELKNAQRATIGTDFGQPVADAVRELEALVR